MLMAGNNITSAVEELRKVNEEYLYHSLINPKPEIEARIRQLRILYRIDLKSYGMQKRQLPYFVCGIFSPAYRKKENFGYTENFIIDIDKLHSKGLALEDVRRRVQADKRVMLCFSSPSEDGLKVMFRLKEKCYDAGVYSVFYKQFVHDFSVQHQLEQVVDTCTSDVSRACFISMDAAAYYNADAEPVDLQRYADESMPMEMFATIKQQREDEKEAQAAAKHVEEHNDLDKETLDAIRAKLNPKSAAKKKSGLADSCVPEQLNDIIADLRRFIEEYGITVTEVINIQYAKKIRARLNQRMAEVNLFYGKRGYSVVISPRCGTDNDLNLIVSDIIRLYLAQ